MTSAVRNDVEESLYRVVGGVTVHRDRDGEVATSSVLSVTVLGATSLRGRGTCVALAGSKLRTLATVLALHAGHAVSAERLMSHLWQNESPPSALKNLHLYVHRFRRHLDDALPGGAQLLTRVGPGYLFDVQPDAIDALRVSSLVRRGAVALFRETWLEAIELLSTALSSWPEEGLVGLVPSPATEAAAAQLRERRLSAVEQLATAELAIGVADRAVDLLLPQAAAHPMRESVHLLLIQALLLSGDRAQAIEVYHSLRCALRDELGIDPRTDIRHVFHAALDGHYPGRITSPV